MSLDTTTSPAGKRPALPANVGGDVDTITQLDALRGWFDGHGAMAFNDTVDGDTHDNTRRAGFAIPALVAFAGQHGEAVPDDAPADVISELIAALRHLCDSLGLAHNQVARRGRDMYLAQLYGGLSG